MTLFNCFLCVLGIRVRPASCDLWVFLCGRLCLSIVFQSTRERKSDVRGSAAAEGEHGHQIAGDESEVEPDADRNGEPK
jgi:hypothetical protein